jgi:hypothetical protein
MSRIAADADAVADWLVGCCDSNKIYIYFKIRKLLIKSFPLAKVVEGGGWEKNKFSHIKVITFSTRMPNSLSHTITCTSLEIKITQKTNFFQFFLLSK